MREVAYRRLISVRPYENVSLELRATVDEGEDVEEVVRELAVKTRELIEVGVNEEEKVELEKIRDKVRMLRNEVESLVNRVEYLVHKLEGHKAKLVMDERVDPSVKFQLDVTVGSLREYLDRVLTRLRGG